MHNGPHFKFIHELCEGLPDEDIREAEMRFARLLDTLYDVAATQRPSESSSPIGARSVKARKRAKPRIARGSK